MYFVHCSASSHHNSNTNNNNEGMMGIKTARIRMTDVSPMTGWGLHHYTCMTPAPWQCRLDKGHDRTKGHKHHMWTNRDRGGSWAPYWHVFTLPTVFHADPCRMAQILWILHRMGWSQVISFLVYCGFAIPCRMAWILHHFTWIHGIYSEYSVLNSIHMD